MIATIPHAACAKPNLSPARSRLPVAFRPTAGGYIRLRREAAGLSIDQAAYRACVSPAALSRAEQNIEDVPPSFIEALRHAFGIDEEIYASLIEGRPIRSLCHSCGCSWFDPCADHAKRPCAWVDATETQCTVCAARERGKGGE